MHTPTTVWQGQARLTCLARHEESPDCASFILAAPPDQHIEFLPGQFVCLGAEINGKLSMRAYSIASDTRDTHSIRVAVRRVPGGLISNWLLDHLNPGAEIDALAPSGDFHLDPNILLSEKSLRHIALFSAGCGITPMLAMTYWLLAQRPDVHIHLFHSAHDESHFVFANEVRELARSHPRFHLHSFLSQTSGRISPAAIQARLSAGETIHAYLCGPQAYMEGVTNALLQHGLSAEVIHSEAFFTPEAPCADASGAAAFALSVPAFGKDTSVQANQTLLDALEKEGLPIIGACRSGACGSCRCHIVSGETHSTTHGPLDNAAVAAGYVLACSTYADSDLTVALG